MTSAEGMYAGFALGVGLALVCFVLAYLICEFREGGKL